MNKAKPLKVTFQGDSDARCVALAMIGQSTNVIMRATKLTPSQVTYRLGKAKALMAHEHGFRTQWRNGEGPVVARVKKDILAVLMADVQRQLPVQIIHTKSQTVGGGS